MALLARDIIAAAQTVLMDAGAVRWTMPELLGWLNDGMTEIAMQKPSATAETATLALVEGTLQSIPDGYIQILRAVRNLSATSPSRVGGRIITTVAREMMDAFTPDWHDPSRHPYAVEATDLIYDPANPRAFYVYPPNTGTGIIEAVLSARPAIIDTPADPTLIASYAIDTGIDPMWRSALTDYVLARAMTKDAAIAGMAARAAGHLQMFLSAVGVRAQAETMASPNTTGAPPKP